MYKTKLQELCHQKVWELPVYETRKEGPDHNPRFHATVTVNSCSFHSQCSFKSSKQAQNEAAKVAFDQLSLPSSPPVDGSSSVKTGLNSNLSSGGTVQLESQETDQTAQGNEQAVNMDDRFTDLQHLFKNQLQIYAQKRGLMLPTYSCERVGPPHACRFKCKVTIDDKIYESLEFFPTVSKAENAAAKVALTSLVPNGVEEDKSAYKNLLQELAQKEHSRLPTYTTVKSGEVHRPTFVSTVEVGGQLFTGEEANTKKQAELSAAKLAYRTLKLHNARQSFMASSLGHPVNSPKALCSGNSSDSSMAANSCNSNQILAASCSDSSSQSAPSSSTTYQGQKAIQLRSELSTFLQNNVQPILPEAYEDNKAIAEGPSHELPIPSPGPESNLPIKRSLVPDSPSVTSSLPSDSATISAAVMEHPVETDIPRYNKVIVHPRGKDMVYPPGSTVLNASDGNWVAVRTPQFSQ